MGSVEIVAVVLLIVFCTLIALISAEFLLKPRGPRS
jgi:hypothetical protein